MENEEKQTPDMGDMLLGRVREAVETMSDIQCSINELSSELQELKRILSLLPKNVFKEQMLFHASGAKTERDLWREKVAKYFASQEGRNNE